MKHNFLLIGLSLICFSANLIVAYFSNGDKLLSFLPHAFCYFFIPLIVFKHFKTSSRMKIFLIFLIPALFIFSVSIHAYILQGYSAGLPFTSVGLVSLFVAFYISRFKNNRKQSIIYTFLVLFVFYGYSNWLLEQDETIVNSKFSYELQIKNSDDSLFNLEDKKGTVLVFDLWSSTCGICFKKFPEFEELFEKYKDDPKVELYSLNLPYKRDSVVDVKRLIKKYSFDKLYAHNLESWNILDNHSVPKIIMIDKKGNVRFKGSMNTNKYLFYNNFHSLIEKLKNE